MVGRTRVSDRAVWQFAASLERILPGVTQLQCCQECWTAYFQLSTNCFFMMIQATIQVFLCTAKFEAAVLPFPNLNSSRLELAVVC